MAKCSKGHRHPCSYISICTLVRLLNDACPVLSHPLPSHPNYAQLLSHFLLQLPSAWPRQDKQEPGWWLNGGEEVGWLL
ncbi:hypothetical protein H8959_005736 [Pygathrix nigripes]